MCGRPTWLSCLGSTGQASHEQYLDNCDAAAARLEVLAPNLFILTLWPTHYMFRQAYMLCFVLLTALLSLHAAHRVQSPVAHMDYTFCSLLELCMYPALLSVEVQADMPLT